MIWIAALIFVAVAGVFGVIYLTGAIGRFEWVRKLSGENKWLRRLISFGLIALGFGAVTLALSLVDAIVVFLHVLFFFLVYGALFAARVDHHADLLFRNGGVLLVGIDAEHAQREVRGGA